MNKLVIGKKRLILTQQKQCKNKLLNQKIKKITDTNDASMQHKEGHE